MSVNPFAGKQKDTQLELAIHNEFSDVDAEIVETPEERPTAWQTLLGMVFGEGVAHLPVESATDERVGKRRMRRLRGRAKEARRLESNYANQ
jgi:hypothetical protein